MPANVDLSTVTDEQRAQIIREERDALIHVWPRGSVRELVHVEAVLNARVRSLGVDTFTGDTTV